MDIADQIDFLKNYFNTKKIVDESTKKKMSNIEVESIRKLIKIKKTDGEYLINWDFTVVLLNGTVYIKDTK